MIIYSCYLPITGKRYIGKTIKPIEKRWKEHCYNSLSKKPKTKFHCSIKSYGKEFWIIEEIEKINDIIIINEREQYWIKYYDTFNSGYNMTEGGDGISYMNDEIKQKIKEARAKQIFPDDWKEKISNSLKGKPKPPRSKEHAKKQSISSAKTRTGKKRGPYKGKTNYSRGYRGIN